MNNLTGRLKKGQGVYNQGGGIMFRATVDVKAAVLRRIAARREPARGRQDRRKKIFAA
jgi:hypothetical protein